MIIQPVAAAIRGDFFSVEGTALAADARLELVIGGATTTLVPDFVMPHLALLGQLPAPLPLGTGSLRLTSATGTPSNSVSVTVSAGPIPNLRVLQSGEAKQDFYHIVLVGNPAIEAATGGALTADPILRNRAGFQKMVVHVFRNLFAAQEDLLRQNNFHVRTKISVLFDPTLPATAANALTHEVVSSTVMEVRRAALQPFLLGQGLRADIVLVVHGSTAYTRSSAWFTTDRAAPSTTFVYDGVTRSHGHFADIPGCAALAVSMPTNGLTVLHEFGHAASDFNNGKVFDLYNDSGAIGAYFFINKKFRALAGTAIPAAFATLDGSGYPADPTRDGLAYPPTWRSYHPEEIDPTRPNVMDNYWAAANPQLCRFDKLSYRWLVERLRAKLTR